jgi:hypothetical protein
MTISDIVTKIYDYTKTNSSSYPAANMLIDINQAYNRVVSKILEADGRWQWDDDNRADLPIATTTITSGQQDYSIAVSHLKILRVELKKNGETRFVQLAPKDQIQLTDGYAVDNVTTGEPGYYDLLGNSIFLYPIPDYTQAASLKVYFQRGPDEFTSGQVSAGTKAPGFNSLYHNLIPLWVAYDYAISNGMNTANGFLAEIERLETQLKKDYGKRDKDDRQIMTMKKISYI